jgi:hypothetical protein
MDILFITGVTIGQIFLIFTLIRGSVRINIIILQTFRINNINVPVDTILANTVVFDETVVVFNYLPILSLQSRIFKS